MLMTTEKTNTIISPISSEEFRSLLDYERCRVDRNSHVFTLIAFQTSNPLYNGKESRFIIEQVFRRCRITDIVGWIDENTIGAFLPDTPTIGGERFADDVVARCNIAGIQCDHTVYTYPNDRLPSIFRINDNIIHEGKIIDAEHNIPQNGSQQAISGNGNGNGNNDDNGKQTTIATAQKKVPLLEKVLAKRIPLWKRAMDFIGSFIALTLLSPVFFLISALIKIFSPGAVFFKQQRVGYAGESFTLWKFRTMREMANVESHQNHFTNLIKSDEPMQKLDKTSDPRITPLGNFLRMSSLDELPQLINVFKGEMSLVGPRPCLAYEAEQYNLWQTKRFDINPGITGLWQVKGKNKTTFKEMIRMDIDYANRLSIWLDIVIIFKTFSTVIKQALEK